MKPNALVDDGNGLHSTGLSFETLGELEAAIAGLNLLAKNPDIFDSPEQHAGWAPALTQIAMALGVTVTAEHLGGATEPSSPVTMRMAEPEGADAVLLALAVAEQFHDDENVRNAARDARTDYDNKLTELAFQFPAAPDTPDS